MDTVFKYGHMVNEGDRFDYVDATQPVPAITRVTVRDAWFSKYSRFTDPRPRWLELWTADPNQIERFVAIKRVGWFEHMYVTPATRVIDPTGRHRDDAMNLRCNGCEHLVRQCICVGE